MSIAKLIITTAVLAAAAEAVPAPQFGTIPVTFLCPIVDSSVEVAGSVWQIGLSVPGGDTISVTETHSVGTTWTEGGDLGISAPGLNIGGSFSVAETVTDAVGEGTSATCPQGSWHCSMQIVPSMAHVKGHLHNQDLDTNSNSESCDVDRIQLGDHGADEGTKFEYFVPMKDSSGNGKWTYDVCTCKNLKHWADKGHPGILCPQSCTPHEL